MKQTVLRQYARLIARAGINVQKGQEVIVQCALDQPRFVELVVDEMLSIRSEIDAWRRKKEAQLPVSMHSGIRLAPSWPGSCSLISLQISMTSGMV